MKWGLAIALLAGLVAAVWLVMAIGFSAVLQSVARAGLGGLALLCVFSLLLTGILALAWKAVLPPDVNPGARPSMLTFMLARMVREAISEISPFSPVGGMVAAARLMILSGMEGRYAAASVVADATTEAMAQVAFLAFGLALGALHFRQLPSAGPR